MSNNLYHNVIIGLSFEGGYILRLSRATFVMAGRTRFRLQRNLRLTRGFFYRQDMVSKHSIFFQGTLLLPVDGSILPVKLKIREKTQIFEYV